MTSGGRTEKPPQGGTTNGAPTMPRTRPILAPLLLVAALPALGRSDGFEPFSARSVNRFFGTGFGPGYHGPPCLPCHAAHYYRSIQGIPHPHAVMDRHIRRAVSGTTPAHEPHSSPFWGEIAWTPAPGFIGPTVRPTVAPEVDAIRGHAYGAYNPRHGQAMAQ
jgi:hypothetical protein